MVKAATTSTKVFSIVQQRSHTARYWTPLCPKGFAMRPSYVFAHTDGYRAQEFRCPLLHPQRTTQTCDHAQFARGPGCVKYITVAAAVSCMSRATALGLSCDYATRYRTGHTRVKPCDALMV